MKRLTKFKVERNYLVYDDYRVKFSMKKVLNKGTWLSYVVFYKDCKIFDSDKQDTLEDIIETIFELEKDDQEYKDREAFNKTLHKIIGRGA